MRRIVKICIFALSILSTAGCVTTPPPSAAGVSHYRQQNYTAATAALRPLAEQGDPTAQYFMALMLFKRLAPASNPTQDGKEFLIAAARAGDDGAFGLLLVLSMGIADRNMFADAIRSRSYQNDGQYPLRGYPDYQGVFDKKTFERAQTIAKGPVSISLLASMASAVEELSAWPPESQSVTISDKTILDIDRERSNAGDKYAAARLGERYRKGVGVEKNAQEAFQWSLKAAKDDPRQRNCVYQAPVGKSAGSVYCYDTNSGARGVPSAILEVCRAYANGAGVTQDLRKARGWCRKAANFPQFSAEATALLNSISAIR